MKRAPKDFDLSTSPIPGNDYIPPKARTIEEITRRRNLAPGELILEQQEKGLRIGHTVLSAVMDRASRDFALRVINLSALNSVWYQYAEPERTLNDSIRRRRLKLPAMKEHADEAALFERVKYGYGQGVTLAREVVRLHGVETTGADRVRRDFSTVVGNAALAGAAVEYLEGGPIPGTELRAQTFAREAAFRMLESRAGAATMFGSVPTLAQLADSDSDVSVWWRRKAPDEARSTFIEAQSLHVAEV